MNLENTIAQALLKIGAVGFSLDNPATFTSGMKAPVYVDNRKFPFWPEEWKLVIEGFAQKIKEENLSFDVIAGIETAGIPHSSALAFLLQKPSVFIRKKAKEHGTKKMIEGGEVRGKKVLLVEDLVTTGASSLRGIEELRREGAVVSDCLVIVTYGFPQTQKAFSDARAHLHHLASFSSILEEALRLTRITAEEVVIVKDWLENPQEWIPR